MCVCAHMHCASACGEVCTHMCKERRITIWFNTSRLEGVEARLQETSEVFEHSRQLARKTKGDFEKVKKSR